MMVVGAVAISNHMELRNQFAERRIELQNQYAHQMQGLLDQSEKRLQQWGTTVAALLSSLADADKPPQLQEMIAEFQRLAAILELNMGVENTLLLSKRGERLAVHGLNKPTDTQPALVEATQQVVTSENPTSLIDCADTCLQY